MPGYPSGAEEIIGSIGYHVDTKTQCRHRRRRRLRVEGELRERKREKVQWQFVERTTALVFLPRVRIYFTFSKVFLYIYISNFAILLHVS